MQKLPLLGSRGKRWSPARRFQGWLATWLQDRRRARQVVAPAAPVITTGGFEWGASAVDWADLWVDWTFAHGSWPVASLEVWLSVDYGAYALVVTLASTESGYYYPLATNTELPHTFKVRYRNGATVGPFSNEYLLDVLV